MDCQLYTPQQVARVLMISRSKVYELMAVGEIQSVHIGKCRRVPQRYLDEFVDRLCADAVRED